MWWWAAAIPNWRPSHFLTWWMWHTKKTRWGRPGSCSWQSDASTTQSCGTSSIFSRVNNLTCLFTFTPLEWGFKSILFHKRQMTHMPTFELKLLHWIWCKTHSGVHYILCSKKYGAKCNGLHGRTFSQGSVPIGCMTWQCIVFFGNEPTWVQIVLSGWFNYGLLNLNLSDSLWDTTKFSISYKHLLNTQIGFSSVHVNIYLSPRRHKQIDNSTKTRFYTSTTIGFWAEGLASHFGAPNLPVPCVMVKNKCHDAWMHFIAPCSHVLRPPVPSF